MGDVDGRDLRLPADPADLQPHLVTQRGGQVDAVDRESGAETPSDALDSDACHAGAQDTLHRCT